MVLFIMLDKAVLNFESTDEIFKCHPIQMKATKHYFPAVVFIMLCNVVLIFEGVDDSSKVTIDI